MGSNSWLKLIIGFQLLLYSTFVYGQSLTTIPEKEEYREIVRVAVRAHSGEEAAFVKWSATMDYLSNSIKGYIFKMIPFVDFDKMRSAVKNKSVDFILTNPTAYIDLEYRYGISRIATLNNLRTDGGAREFAAVLFTLSSYKDINKLEDVKGKSLMGVNPEAFGGWRMAYYEMLESGIDPFKSCSKILFSPDGTQESVVFSVLAGDVDIGTVRTGILENMIAKNLITPEKIKIINKQTDSFFLIHSTRMYPEWPFSKLKHTSDFLAVKVLTALLHINQGSRAAVEGGYTGWTIPLDYTEVHKLLKTIKAPPCDYIPRITFLDILKLYWKWIITGIIFLVVIIAALIFVSLLNNKLKTATLELRTLNDSLEKKVEEKTVNIKNKNIQLKISEENSQIERDNFKHILESMNDGVYIVNQRYDIQYVNPVLVKDFGDYKGKKCYKYFHDRREVCPWCKNQDVYHGRTVQWEWFSFKNGKTYDLIDTPIKNPDGSISKLEIFRDITERKLVEQELKNHKEHLEELVALRTLEIEKSNKKLRKSQQAMVYLLEDVNEVRAELQKSNLKLKISNQDLEAFTHTVSHDLRSPLRAIDGFVTKLKNHLIDNNNSETERLLAVISNNTIKMQQLISDLLSFAKINTHTESFSTVNIRVLVLSILDSLEEKVKKYNIKINVTDLPDSYCNYSMIRQVFINLIENAVKFTKLADKPEITIGYLNSDNKVYYVKDNGCGFENKFSSNVFEIFKRVTNDKHIEGTGVGLAIVKRIVESHGGEVWAESEPGKGSTFYFALNNKKNNVY